MLRSVLLAMACLLPLAAGDAQPSTPGHHKCRTSIPVGKDTVDLPYSLYLPKDYAAGAKHPMLIFLHGAGEGGNDLNGIFAHGPDPALRDNAKLRDVFPFVLLSPQCNGRRWDDPVQMQATVALVDRVASSFRVDTDRIYVTGLSMGGKGTWLLALAASDRLAAIAPISAVAVDPEQASAKLKAIASWIIVGGNDGGYTEGSRQMASALEKSGNTVQIAVVPGGGHGPWGYYYTNPRFYAWFLRFRRGVAGESKPDARVAAWIEGLHAAGSPLPRTEAELESPGTPVGTSRGVQLAASRLTPGGLRGQYFEGTAFEKPLTTRVDAVFNWPSADFKLPGDRRENFSVRWTGMVRVDAPGLYTFHTTADDGQRLRIGPLTVIDDWTMHGATPAAGTIEMTSGWHPIVVEYMQGAGEAAFQLAWQGPGFKRQPIPAERLAVPAGVADRK